MNGPRPAADQAPDQGPERASDPAEEAWALMYRFVDAHNRRGELAEALGFRLGGGRGRTLVRLRRGPLTLSQLAEAIGADAPYTTVIVDKLEAHGLVERQPHPADRRRKLVALTAAGQDAVATADAVLLRPPPALRALGSRELELLAGLLGRVLAADGSADAPARSDAPAAD